MQRTATWATLIVLCVGSIPTGEPRWSTTRVTDLSKHQKHGRGKYPFRDHADGILQELDLRAGDVVVDIGAGDGFWAEQMAEAVGSEGVVHASEVKKRLVERMKSKYEDEPRIRPYLSPTDGTGLEKDSCDLAFFAQVYHHLDHAGQVDYLLHLRQVLKPGGRLAIIERYSHLTAKKTTHGTDLSQLLVKAEESGWVPVRCQMIEGTLFYLAIFVQKDLFTKTKRAVL